MQQELTDAVRNSGKRCLIQNSDKSCFLPVETVEKQWPMQLEIRIKDVLCRWKMCKGVCAFVNREESCLIQVGTSAYVLVLS